ncbi:hypothetical protein GF343_00920 [Candidatus Woesearchaeota archaeon]|nr:hypothetical protein [Candidatus Woesearchaeota archaeon]
MEKKKRKHRLRNIAGLGFAGMALLLGGLTAGHLHKKSMHQSKWGTLENPRYKITCSIKEEPATFQDYITAESAEAKSKAEQTGQILNNFGKSNIKKIKQRHQELSSYFANHQISDEQRKQLDNYYSDITAQLIEGAPEGLEEYIARLGQLERLKEASYLLNSEIDLRQMEQTCSETTETIDRITKEVKFVMLMQLSRSSSLADKYGDVQDYARKLFEEMTEKPLPEGVTINIEEIAEKEVAGLANFLQGSVKSEDAHYARVLMVMMHELGHLSAQQRETAYFSLNPFSAGSREVTLLEEACAYAFEIAAAYKLMESNEELGKTSRAAIFLYTRDFAQEYFKGESEYHREAMAIADAAVTVFGDAAKAYNYLAAEARPGELDPRITAVIEENRRKYEFATREGHSGIEEIKQMDKDIFDLYVQVHPKGKEEQRMHEEALKAAEEEMKQH